MLLSFSIPGWIIRTLLTTAVLLTGAAPFPATAQTAPVAPASPQLPAGTGFVEKVFTDQDGPHKYVVFVPAGYRADRAWPTILFLHGAGERGRDGQIMVNVGLGPMLKLREQTFPFLVVFPQAESLAGPIKTTWSPMSPDGERALRILEQVERDYRVDPEHRILTGWSMGGYGAWEVAAAHPERFSAVVPLAGGLRSGNIEPLRDVPIWAFHGALDVAVPVSDSLHVVEQLRGINPQLRYTQYDDGDHEIWTAAYADDRLFQWMLNPGNTEISQSPLSPTPKDRGKPPFPSAIPPFIPALDVPHAFHVRVGNDVLEQIAAQLPRQIPATALQGTLPDMAESTTVSGVDFTVQLSGITYSARVGGVTVRSLGANLLRVQLAIQQATIQIGSTYVDGPGRKAAQAGPMQIAIGQSRPVWLTFDVAPRVNNRRIELPVVSTDFQIPPDNWAVSGPAGVSTQGMFMDSRRVASGLVDGLYSSRGKIEQQVGGAVPGLVHQLEQTLNNYLLQGNEAVAGIWPLPVYQPRIRTWPSDLVCDKDGISLCLGLTASAIDPQRPPRWVIVPPASPGAASVPKTQGLAVGLAPQVIYPLSQLLIAARMTSIHLIDTPTQSLQHLVDPDLIRQLFPDLARHGEGTLFSGELSLVEAIEPKPGDGANQLVFQMPKLRITYSYRNSEEDAKWLPFARSEVTIRHVVTPHLERPRFAQREFLFEWDKTPDVTVHTEYAADYAPEKPEIDQDRLGSIIRDGWTEYTTSGPSTRTKLPEFDLAGTKLRAKSLDWTSPFMNIQYGPAGIRVTNASNQPVAYQTRGPATAWSKEWSLQPGESHDFPVAYSVTFRSVGGKSPQELTLPAGSHCEFLEVKGQVGLYLARLQPRASNASRTALTQHEK